jgi:diadenosine tetraphosphatase ApaH/serine/threonine PP2A family protein phosphatase
VWLPNCTWKLKTGHSDSIRSMGIGEILFCHATPRSDEEIITELTPDDRLREILFDIEQNLMVCGHVHMQYDRRLDGKRIVNAGSVGMPYQGEPVGAFWLLVGPGIEFRRSEYDLQHAVSEFRAIGYPGRGHGREPARAAGSGVGGRLLRATSRRPSVESYGVDWRTQI